jgi:hypothetical protein
MAQVILTTIAIKYSLSAYSLKGRPYFDAFNPQVFSGDIKKNKEVLIQLQKLEPQLYKQNMIDNFMLGVIENTRVNEDKKTKLLSRRNSFYSH